MNSFHEFGFQAVERCPHSLNVFHYFVGHGERNQEVSNSRSVAEIREVVADMGSGSV
jgi:hypothetical protein